MSYDDLARNLDTYADGHCREANPDDDCDASLDFEAWGDILAGEYPNLTPVLLLCADRETGTLQSFGGIGVNADAMRDYLRRAATSAEGEHRTINVETSDASAKCERCKIRAADPCNSTPGNPRCGHCAMTH